MFKGYLLGLALLWIFTLLASCYLLSTPSSQALQVYHQVMTAMNHQSNGKGTSHITQQTRTHVSKQLLYKQDDERLQSRLTSESSELIFEKKTEGTEFFEHFKEIDCTIQEKLFYTFEENTLQPKQLIRHLKAQQGVYSYKTGQLQAQEVELSRYMIPGHLWPISFASSSTLFEGRAQQIQLSLSQEPTFKAQGLQATLHDWGNGW